MAAAKYKYHTVPSSCAWQPTDGKWRNGRSQRTTRPADLMHRSPGSRGNFETCSADSVRQQLGRQGLHNWQDLHDHLHDLWSTGLVSFDSSCGTTRHARTMSSGWAWFRLEQIPRN